MTYRGSGGKNGGPGGGNPANWGGKRAPGNICTHQYFINCSVQYSMVAFNVALHILQVMSRFYGSDDPTSSVISLKDNV